MRNPATWQGSSKKLLISELETNSCHPLKQYHFRMGTIVEYKKIIQKKAFKANQRLAPSTPTRIISTWIYPWTSIENLKI